MPTILTLPDPSTELGAALEVALAACDEADALAMASFRQAIDVDGQAGRLLRDGGRHGRRAGHPRAHRVRASRTMAWSARSTASRPRRAAGAGSSTPSTAPTTTCAACPSSPRCWPSRSTGSSWLGVVSAPALHRRWFAWQGGGAWAAETGPDGWRPASAVPISVSRSGDLDEASLVYSSVPSLQAVALRRASSTSSGVVWRDRGLGDFYGYMLVAEGAAEAMVEADLKIWDLAGPRAVLEEAGGRVTDLTGGPDLPARGVLASNGHLHERAPGAGWQRGASGS